MTVARYRHREMLAAAFGHADVTPHVEDWVERSGVKHGLVVVQIVGSTGAVTTIEYEPGVLEDLRRAVERLAPEGERYAHDARWHDGNGFSHVRSALVKTAISIPIVDGRPALGSWQQVVAINFDNREREREVVGIVVGE